MRHLSRHAFARFVVCCLAWSFGRAPCLAWDEPQVEVVVDGLSNPTGVAVQPGTGHVYVAESGASRVIRVVENGKVEEAIINFPVDEYGPGPKYKIGPLGIAFLNAKLLIIGGGGYPDGEDLLRVYETPEAAKPAKKASEMRASFKLAAEGEVKGEGNFFGVAITETGVFVTCNGDDEKGWLGKADRNGLTVGPFRRLVATKPLLKTDAPTAVTTSPAGEIVVGQMGEIDESSDSRLAFFASDGRMLDEFPIGLRDVTALAYSPKGNLYATDFAWAKSDDGGLFQLIAERRGVSQKVAARRVLPLEKATALAFGKDGELYITVFGKDGKDGKLLRVAPGL